MVSVGRMKTGGGASAPLPFFSLRPYVVGVQKTGHKIWRRSGHLWVSQVNKRWRGRLPLRCADMRWLPAPRLTRPPARAIGFSGVPAANGGARLRAALRGSAACVSRRRL